MLDTVTRLSMLQERFKSGTQKIFIESLNDALVIITGNLSNLEDLAEIKRQVAIKRLIEKEINTLYGKLIEPIKEDMQGFAELENEGMFSALNKDTGLGYAFAGLPKETMQKIISMKEIRLVGDKAYTLTDLFDNAKVAQINNYKQIIAGGLASNSGYANITKRLKEANARATTNLDAIVHTAISSARDEADKHTYKQFDDVITGWKSVSVLDSRTSLLCASLDGRMYYKKQGYPTYEKIPNRPPRHFRCRSKLVPKTDFKTDSTRPDNATFKEKVKLKDKDGNFIRFKTGPNAGKIKTKSVLRGEVGQTSNKTKFEGWFSNQSADFQRNYLGKGRYDLYKSGKVKIKDFVDIKSGERFTLAEIRAKFVGAKITPPKPKDIPIVEKIVKPAKKPKSAPKIPAIDFGYPKGRFNEYVKGIVGDATRIIHKLPKPNKIKHGAKAWYRGYNISRSYGGDLQTTKYAPTFLHEYGHFIDQILAHRRNKHHYYSARLEKFAIEDAKLYGTSRVLGKGQFKKERVHIPQEKIKELIDELYTHGEKTTTRGRKYTGYILRNESDRQISDIFDSLTLGDFQAKNYGVFGHGRNYYLKSDKAQAENFANLFSNWSQGGKAWERTVKYFPNLSAEFEIIMKEVLNGEFD